MHPNPLGRLAGLPMTRHSSFAHFHTTMWTMVRAAGDAAAPDRAEALEQLCRAYWYPLYAFLRRRGTDAEQAADLVQGLFAELLERDDLDGLTPEGGRFRAYLLGALKHHASNERRAANALKRGGGVALISIDADEAEQRYRVEPVDEDSPERLFERRWALTLLERAMERLGAEQEVKGRSHLFAELRGHLAGEPKGSHASAAQALGLTTGAVKVAVHRLRARYRELLREEVRHTVDDDFDPDQELRDLVQALG